MQDSVRQGFVLLLLLFPSSVRVIAIYAEEGLMNKILHADDLVLISENIENLIQKLLKWKEAFESKGLKVTLRKIKVMVSSSNKEMLNENLD